MPPTPYRTTSLATAPGRRRPRRPSRPRPPRCSSPSRRRSRSAPRPPRSWSRGCRPRSRWDGWSPPSTPPRSGSPRGRARAAARRAPRPRGSRRPLPGVPSACRPPRSPAGRGGWSVGSPTRAPLSTSQKAKPSKKAVESRLAPWRIQGDRRACSRSSDTPFSAQTPRARPSTSVRSHQAPTARMAAGMAKRIQW